MEFYEGVEGRWIISIVAAILSIATIFPGVYIFGFLAGPISLFFSIPGIAMGIFSVLSKEKKWGLGAVGIVLSGLVPLYAFMVSIFG